MKESRFIKGAIVVLIILLTVDIGSRILFNPSEAKAAGKVEHKMEYKVVELRNDNDVQTTLNDMANQGWEFHSLSIFARKAALIFKKQT